MRDSHRKRRDSTWTRRERREPMSSHARGCERERSDRVSAEKIATSMMIGMPSGRRRRRRFERRRVEVLAK
jgi:hypothetical protein